MKMLPEHIEHIRATIAAAFTTFDLLIKARVYKKAGLTPKHLAWDLLRECGLMQFVCDALYPYLNDVHIDTALRAIIKELKIHPWEVS